MGRKKKFICADELQNGMKIEDPVKDRLGRTLIAHGAVLDDFMIEALPRLGILGVYISDGEEEEAEKPVIISTKARKVIEKLEVPDRTKVKLTESVKKRVVEGIQFLYTDTESENFENTANSITNDLMKAIMLNDPPKMVHRSTIYSNISA